MFLFEVDKELFLQHTSSAVFRSLDDISSLRRISLVFKRLGQGIVWHTFSAIAYTVALRCAEGIIGMMDASIMRRFRTPCTSRSDPTTPPNSTGIIAAVPQGWNVEGRTPFRRYCAMSASVVTLEPGMSSTGPNCARVGASLNSRVYRTMTVLSSKSSGLEKARKSTTGSPLGFEGSRLIDPRLNGLRFTLPREQAPPNAVSNAGILSEANTLASRSFCFVNPFINVGSIPLGR